MENESKLCLDQLQVTVMGGTIGHCNGQTKSPAGYASAGRVLIAGGIYVLQ